MERELPRTMVAQHEYVVDMWNGELRSVSNPDKSLELFKMDADGPRLSFNYDTVHMRIAGRPRNEAEATGLKRVMLLPRHLDPEFYKEIESQKAEALKIIDDGKSVFDLPGSVHESALESTSEGKGPSLLPMVNLYGTEFFLDTRLKELRQVDNPANSISFLHLDPDEMHHTIIYDTSTKNAFKGTFSQARQTEGVKALVLPPMDIMIRDGIKRHEAKIRNTATSTTEANSDRSPERRMRPRKKGMKM